MVKFVVSAVVTAAAIVVGGLHWKTPPLIRQHDDIPAGDHNRASVPAEYVATAKSVTNAAERADKGHAADIKNGSEELPWLHPTPPLLELALNADTPEVRLNAQEVNRWLKLTVDLAIVSCWKRRPPKPVWAEFAATLDGGDEPTILKISGLDLVKIHGDYSLSAEEAHCITENIGTIRFRQVSENALQALAPYFPLSHRFAVQWPCGNCAIK